MILVVNPLGSMMVRYKEIYLTISVVENATILFVVRNTEAKSTLNGEVAYLTTEVPIGSVSVMKFVEELIILANTVDSTRVNLRSIFTLIITYPFIVLFPLNMPINSPI